MNVYEGEPAYQLVKYEGDNSYYNYVGRRGDKVDFGVAVDRHPDSFSVAWKTTLTVNEFLEHACRLIDEVAALKPSYRPTDTDNPIIVVSLSISDADTDGVIKGRVRSVGSYSAEDYNNIQLNLGNPPGYAKLRLDQLNWPINSRDIDKAIELGLGGVDRFQVTDRHFVRVNGEFCSVLFNGVEPGLFTYWSHVPAIDALTGTYEATTVSPGVSEQFRDAVNILVGPSFAQYLGEQNDGYEKTPEEMFTKSMNFYLHQYEDNPNYADYSDEQKRIRAIGETYNNFVLRIPLLSGEKRFAVNQELVQRVDQMMDEMGINKEEFYEVFDRLQSHMSFNNPVFVDFDRIMRPVALELMRRYKYTPTDLFA